MACQRTARATVSYLRLLARCAWVCALSWTGCLRRAKRRLRNSGGIMTLTFHRILDDDSYDVTNSLPGIVVREGTFRDLVRYLAAEYEAVALANAAPGIPSKTVRFVLTFDDGWSDNYTTAFPILSAYRVPFTIFVCPGLLARTGPFWPERAVALLRAVQPDSSPDEIEKTIEWLKRQTADDREEYLTVLRERAINSCFEYSSVDWTLSWDEITEMDQAGICFGSHTNSHQILTAIPASLAREELRCSKAALEQVLSKSCTAFAYPNGNWSPETREIVAEAGFKRAVTTERGVWTAAADLLAIPRSNVCESNVVGITGRFWPAMFEYTTLWKSWRATSARALRVAPDRQGSARPTADA